MTAKFGTDDFNAQIAAVNAIMRVPGLVISLVGVFAAIWLVQNAVKRRYGPDASLLEPAKLAAAMRRARGGAGVRQRSSRTQRRSRAARARLSLFCCLCLPAAPGPALSRPRS